MVTDSETDSAIIIGRIGITDDTVTTMGIGITARTGTDMTITATVIDRKNA